MLYLYFGCFIEELKKKCKKKKRNRISCCVFLYFRFNILNLKKNDFLFLDLI